MGARLLWLFKIQIFFFENTKLALRCGFVAKKLKVKMKFLHQEDKNQYRDN